MDELCLVTTCKGRLSALRQSLGPMLDQPGVSCVVVDYSCPDGAGDWVEATHRSARVVRVPDRPEFNASAARNIGARHADAPWLGFVDSDVVLDPNFAATVRPALAPGGFYRARSDDPGLGGTFLCAREDFERVGGYDENYACWGEEDNDLFDAFQFIGLEQRFFPGSLLRHLPHDDTARTRFYPITDKVQGHAVNRVYRILKWDTARVRRELLPADLRQALHDKAAEVVTASLQTGQPGDLSIQLPVGLVPGGWSLSRRLSYRLTRNP
jgi:GT2 family glycosyltransferase